MALGWRALGYHDFLSDTVPGVFTALLVHELVAQMTIRSRRADTSRLKAANESAVREEVGNR